MPRYSPRLGVSLFGAPLHQWIASRRRVCVSGRRRPLRSIPVPAYEPALAVERSSCSVLVCVIGIREIFVFEYQTQRLPRNSRQWSGQICVNVRSGARRVCYEECTHTVRQRFPSRSLKPLPTHPGLRPHPTRTDLRKAGRSQRPACPFQALVFDLAHAAEDESSDDVMCITPFRSFDAISIRVCGRP